MTMTKQDRICMISLFAVMLVLMGVPALCLSTNTVVDELGTLTNTALLTGRNWGTGILSNGGYYYRYGMAFVWLLPFLIFKDPIIVYKAASFVNALFMATTPVMAYYIGRRYLKLEKEKDAALLAAGSAIISSVMFQAIYLRGDMMLIVLNWVCALFILNAMYAKTKKERQIYTILLSFCAVYAYACHSRGIVMVIASAMTVLLIPFFTKERERRIPYISFFGSMAVFLVIDKILVKYFRHAIWGNAAAHATGIPKGTLKLLRKGTGIKSYIRMAIGWLYNSFSSTLGLVCVGLIALCAANPKGSGTPTEDPPADRTETGQWPSVEAYVQQVMLSQTEARYYAENADGTVSDQPHTAAVTDRKLEYLTKGGELAGLDPDGVLEEWEYFYLVKLDVDTASVALVGGQYYDDEEYFSLDDRHVMVALRHDDGNYDILCDDSINDGGDFFGYHNTMEEAIYDWYVTDRKLDLPLYVEDWIDQINYNNPNDKPGNYPVHRYDVDGGYLYIPGSAWIMADVTAHRSHGHWEWYSGYDTGSILTVDRFTQTLEDEYITSRKQGFEPLDDTKQIWKRRQGGINERYYFYPAADGNGCWRIWTLWTDLGISNYVHIFIEPQVMYLMAESFTPTESFPAAGASTRTTMASTYRAEVDGRAADLTVSYTVEQKNGELQLCSLDSARARNVHGWEQVHLAATVEQHQSLFGSGLYQYLVPVFYEADRGNGWETFQAVVEISLTGQYSPRHTLTQEELAAYNAVMDPAVRDESGDIVDFHIQPFSYFFSSYYENVRNLNFEEFIRYFPDSGQATEAEFEALKKLDDWPFKRVARMEDMPVPIHRHTVSSINEVLTRWGGITTSNLDTSGVCYLEEYDAYYTFTSDFNMFYFIAESGEQVGNYVYLRKSVENGNIAVLTLRLVPGTDEWQIVSHWCSGS